MMEFLVGRDEHVEQGVLGQFHRSWHPASAMMTDLPRSMLLNFPWSRNRRFHLPVLDENTLFHLIHFADFFLDCALSSKRHAYVATGDQRARVEQRATGAARQFPPVTRAPLVVVFSFKGVFTGCLFRFLWP